MTKTSQSSIKPDISILLPVYNAESFLKLAIKSILQQSFENFELLVLDDGSTDTSQEIILDINDPRIIYFPEIKNKGIIYQLNKGLHAAKANLIARMDADDIAHPERLQKQFDFLNQHQSTKMVGSAVSIIDNQGSFIQEGHVASSQEDILYSFCRMKNPFYHPSVMFRKESVVAIGGYRANFLHMEDFDLWFRLYQKGLIMVNLEQPLLQYRIHDHQISNEKRFEQIESLSSFLQARLDNKCSENELKTFLEIVRWNQYKAHSEDQYKLLLDIWEELLKCSKLKIAEKKYIAKTLINNYFLYNIYSLSTIQLINEIIRYKHSLFQTYFLDNLKERLKHYLGLTK